MPVRPITTRVDVTQEMELSIVKELMNTDDSYTVIAKRHKVSASTVSRINRDYNDKGVKDAVDTETKGTTDSGE